MDQSEYIENAERTARLVISEHWTVTGVNFLVAGQVVAGIGYGRGWMSAIILFGVWFGLTCLWGLASSKAAYKSWSEGAYKRKIDAQHTEEEDRMRQVCAKMLYENGLLKT